MCFYNDAYRPPLGNKGKHPYLLGERAEDHWQETWHIIKPLIDQVLSGGEANDRLRKWFSLPADEEIELRHAVKYSPNFPSLHNNHFLFSKR